MIKYKDIFNSKTLNIFTDASIRNVNNETIGAPGYVAVLGDQIISQDVRILRESTNNQSEIYAIYMAIQFALKYRNNVQVINVFSDSQFSIYGLREWIFNWMNNIYNDILYNSSGNMVSNQNIILAIIYTIIDYKLVINLYHNRGHFTIDKIPEFIELFKKHNFLNDYIDREAAEKIIRYNSIVDHTTRSLLHNTKVQYPDKLEIPDYLARTDLNMNYYKELLNI